MSELSSMPKFHPSSVCGSAWLWASSHGVAAAMRNSFAPSWCVSANRRVSASSQRTIGDDDGSNDASRPADSTADGAPPLSISANLHTHTTESGELGRSGREGSAPAAWTERSSHEGNQLAHGGHFCCMADTATMAVAMRLAPHVHRQHDINDDSDVADVALTSHAQVTEM
jgi:hypothetical protein